MLENLKVSRGLMNTYFSKELFRKPKKKAVMVYDKYNIQVGRLVRREGIYTLNVKESSRILFLGLTRSGKTFFMRSIIDRLRQIGYDVIYLSDVKNEFWSSNNPVQEKFRDGLLPGEKPKGMDIVTLRPTFFKQVRKTLDKQNFWYSVNPKEITRNDFMTLLNSDDLTHNQRTALELVYQGLQKKMKGDKNYKFSLQDIYKIIDEEPDLEPRSKTALKFKFKPLETATFFEEKYERSVIEIMKRGFVPAINMESFDSFGKGSFLFPEVTLNIVLREVIEGRRRGKINKVMVVIDEASRFVGKSKKTSIKSTVEESYELDTRYGVNYCSAFQSWSDIPERILNNTRYIFVPRSADIRTIKSAIIDTGKIRNIQVSTNKAIKIKEALKKNPYSWMVIDRIEDTLDLITPLPPLSWHLETKK